MHIILVTIVVSHPLPFKKIPLSSYPQLFYASFEIYVLQTDLIREKVW